MADRSPQLAVDARITWHDSSRLGLVYGDLDGTSDDNAAALNVWCSNTSGTALGQLKNTWVIYSYNSDGLRTIATLVPQQREAEVTNTIHVPYFASGLGELQISPGRIVAVELWYGLNDGTCCPSVTKTTTWEVQDGMLKPISTE